MSMDWLRINFLVNMVCIKYENNEPNEVMCIDFKKNMLVVFNTGSSVEQTEYEILKFNNTDIYNKSIAHNTKEAFKIVGDCILNNTKDQNKAIGNIFENDKATVVLEPYKDKIKNFIHASNLIQLKSVGWGDLCDK